MGKNIKPCECGCNEFITQLNQYDVYLINEGKLEFVETLNTNEDDKLYCRECGKVMRF